MSKPVGRRDFLNPGRLLAGAADLQKSVAETIHDAAPIEASKTVTFRCPAMACLFEIQLAANDPNREWAARAFEWIDDLEAQLTVYRDDSEVTAINRQAADQPVQVEPNLFDLLVRCADLTELTAGAFDITAGPLIRTWGFFRRQGRIPTAAEIVESRACVGMEKVQFDRERKTVRFAKPGIELNFGAIGKGFALDRVAYRLRANGVQSALLSAGHSSMLAIGTPAWDSAWQVDLGDPRPRTAARSASHGVENRLARIRLKDLALSTTGISEQSFELEGRRYGHVIDPRSGQPASGILQATAIAADAATAEALSTAFFVNGVDWTRQFCQRSPDVAAILLPLPTSAQKAQPLVFSN